MSKLFMFVNGEKEVRMYDNTDHNTDAKVKEEYTLMEIVFGFCYRAAVSYRLIFDSGRVHTLMEIALEAGDVLTFNTKDDGEYSAITIVFDTYSKGVTFADNALTTKSAAPTFSTERYLPSNTSLYLP